MKSLVCPFLALCVVVARAAIIPDCSGVDKNAAVKCTGSVLEGEGHCGEDVCAQQEGEVCHVDFMYWPGPEAKPAQCDDGLRCKPAPGFGIKGWGLWGGKGSCEVKA